ncbi:MAG TPA: hypothetical protein PLD25_07225 [Chloroflexota bacterium]|nr:hypothetical protein [Chloroflexota bacterium]HUM68573.1 hypothetical protein [Chloroflexota bacterium]
MNLPHAEMLNELHHRRIREATAVEPLPTLPPQPSNWRGQLANGVQLLTRLRQVRVQVTFELVEPCPEG